MKRQQEQRVSTVVRIASRVMAVVLLLAERAGWVTARLGQ